MLTYMEVHLYYTLPPTIFLYLLYRPFISGFEKIKIVTLCLLALVYTTPWDNYIIYHKAWWYRKDAVLGTIGYVPIEEYIFFIIQTIFTSLWASCCSRWSLNSLFLRNTNRSKQWVHRYVTITFLFTIACCGWMHAIPATKTFYLGCITWWSLIVVIFVWYVAGSYIVHRYIPIVISVLVPTIYLCYVDLVALRARVWHINEETSLEIFPIEDLPIEECTFFLVTNTIVVMGSAAFDKSKAVIDTYFTEPFPVGSNVCIKEQCYNYAKMLFTGSLTNENSFDPQVIDDIETCIQVLDKASKSFSLAGNLFPNDIKQDLTILYAFCRVTDDMIDNENSIELKKNRLNVIIEFLDQLFENRIPTKNYNWTLRDESNPSSIRWKYFEENLSSEQLSSFRSISRIAYYLPQEPFYELVDGYKWDIDGRLVNTENDLLEYSKCVASSVATLCTFIFCHKSYRWPDNFGPKCQTMLENARKMGLVLQICNISRDIITDSETLGRCYVPTNYFTGDELKYLIVDRNPHKIPNLQLKKYAEKMLDIANYLTDEALFAINLLPVESQRAVLGALEIYRGIGKTIRSNASYERRTVLGKWEKLRIILKCLYITNIPALENRVNRKSS